MRTGPVLVLVCLLCAIPALGLEPYLVKDINPVAAVTGSSPSNFASLGGVAVFTAFDGESGLGFWRSDGTAAGTWKLADVCAVWPSCGWVQILAVAGGRAFLAAGGDLWVTDGTTAGTLLLEDDLEGFAQEAEWVPEQRVLYFLGADPAHGIELWRTDGTPAGTHLVADLMPGPQSPPIGTLTAFRGRLWFAAVVPHAGGSLWRSDGTERGTVPVQQGGGQNLPHLRGVAGKRLVYEGWFGKKGPALWAIDGAAHGPLQIFRLRSPILDSVVQNGRLFFVAVNPGHGQELWVSDGTPRGTRVVSDIPGKDSFFAGSGAYHLPLPRTSLPGRFLFQAADPAHGVELWASDGVSSGSAGTRLVRDVCPGPCTGTFHVLTTNQGLFYFSGSDGTHGAELWASDGVSSGSAGTRMVRDLCAGECSGDPDFPVRFAGRLLFSAYDSVNGRELWTTDGTAAGTVRATGFALDSPFETFQGAVADGRFVFAAADDEHGFELWSTNGTVAGTSFVEDINQADFGGSVISGIRALGDQAVFFADDGIHGYELWKSDGMPADTAGTSLVAELWPGSEPSAPPAVLASAEAGGKLYLLLFSDGFSLWRTDGSAAGTVQLRGPSASPGLWDGSGLVAVGGTVFFTLSYGDLGLQLWATDGTVAGTRQVVDAGPGKALSNPNGLAELGGKLYFFATAADGMQGLWSSDGTASGTVQVKSFGAPYGAVPLPTVHAGRLWFRATTPGGVALWSSDGTAAGTRIEPLPGLPQSVGFMASTGAKLMISGYEPGRGFELWASDGTAEGTEKVGPAVFSYGPRSPWAVFQGRLVYAVDEQFDGYPKLWISDGTPEGTGRLLDRDGKPIPAPINFAVLNDRLFFTTAIPAQVWESDGKPAGTGPLARQRPIGFNPGAVGRAGSRVFFGAWEPETGQELWAVEP